jgi:hypothetical protein
MSIICSSARWWFSANNKHLLIAIKCSIALSKFEVVLSKIPRYLKVYTHSIMSPSNTNSWHGSTKLNTMIFVFFTFTISPCLAQNYWSAFNYRCSPTFDFDVRTRSFPKSNSHTCMSARAGASYFLPSKRPFRASKYSPNSMGLRGQLCFTPLLALEARGDTLAWVVNAHDILGIHRL